MKPARTLLPMLALLITLPLTINALSTQKPSTPTPNKTHTTETMNVDGDLSLSESENRNYWNPHTTGYTNATAWTATYNKQAQIYLTTSESGHIASGAWWTTSFKTKCKIPLYTNKPANIAVAFEVNIVSLNYTIGSEWLRIALASAIKRADSQVVYTEMDLWDSPNTLNHPSGNVREAGNIIYKGGDVVEYKIDQAPIGNWTTHSLDLTSYINQAWTLKPGDNLESVYVVIETIHTTTQIMLNIRNLWITQTA